MFRRVYWVTESVQNNGSSEVSGVYTSIPNLIRHGMRHAPGSRLRLTLTALDSDHAPFGSWIEPHFDGLNECLESFVRTEEFSREQCAQLLYALKDQRIAA
jgi:hypothetical protein